MLITIRRGLVRVGYLSDSARLHRQRRADPSTSCHTRRQAPRFARHRFPRYGPVAAGAGVSSHGAAQGQVSSGEKGGTFVEREFWVSRWEQNLTGFHLTHVNPTLASYWPTIGLPQGATVFVPLCGKSLDMRWLRDAGYQVIGVEVSPIAVRDFFTEQQITYDKRVYRAGELYESQGLRVFCGDYFELMASEVGPIDAIYDRAAMVALPSARRADYARHLGKVAPDAHSGMLITLEYDQSEMSGPPFAVTSTEIDAHYPAFLSTRLIKRESVLDREEKFRQRGVTALHEASYALNRNE